MLRDYHVDAEDRYNVTCDFHSVIRELTNPGKRFPFQVSGHSCTNNLVPSRWQCAKGVGGALGYLVKPGRSMGHA